MWNFNSQCPVYVSNCQIISDSFLNSSCLKRLDKYIFFANIICVKTRLKLVSLLGKIPQHISIFYTWSINLENNSLVFSAYTRAFVTWKVDLRTFIPIFPLASLVKMIIYQFLRSKYQGCSVYFKNFWSDTSAFCFDIVFFLILLLLF